MAESKRTFQSGLMNKDSDDRVVPAGQYRDALNVSVDFSEDSNVGALENLKGNELIANQDILGLSAATNPNVEVIGSYAHPEENKIYYFITGDKTDGIFEYNADNGEISPIILDSSTEPVAAKSTMTFADAGVSATITQNGNITIRATLGNASVITPKFDANNTGSAILRYVDVSVIVPNGFLNAGETLIGQVSASQASKTIAADITTRNASNVTTTSAKLNGEYGQNSVGVTAVGFYWGYNTAGTALTISELQNGGSGVTRSTVNVSSVSHYFSSEVTSIPPDKLVSFVAFATNSIGTNEGAVKTFETASRILGFANFSGTLSGPTGSKTAGGSLSWSISGTSTVTDKPVGGSYSMHSDATKTSGSGTAWYPGTNWATAPDAIIPGATSSWSHSETTTAPTTPGTYSWAIKTYYDSNIQANGSSTGSFTIPTPPPPPPVTSGTITLAADFFMGPNAGVAFGGGIGNLLSFTGSAPSSWTVGTNVTLTFGGSTNVIELDAVSASGSNTDVAWTLVSGGGTAASSGYSINWSI